MSRFSRSRIGMVVFVLACAVPAYSHHSFANTYFERETVTIEGEVVEFVYRAPHAWLYVTAADPQGRVQRYGAEWSGPSRLERIGVPKDAFQAGDRVTVIGSPSRDESVRNIHLKKVTRHSRGQVSWGQAPARR